MTLPGAPIQLHSPDLEASRPSQTAIASALMRAAHLLLDAPPAVLRDDFALPLSGWKESALIAGFAALQTKLAQETSPTEAKLLLQSVRAITVLRARYVEDLLAEAHQRGVRQYVVLGAGLDSYALRTSLQLSVFELDHPSTQGSKRERLAALGLKTGPQHHFVPIDFEAEPPLRALARAGFRAELPTFFSWLGVINYLGQAAIFDTLRALAQLPPESAVVFDYVLPDYLLDAAGRRLVSTLLTDMSARGEPGQSFFSPEELGQRVRSLGFREVVDLGPEEANARYFSGRSDELRLPQPCPAHLMHARVS